MCRKNCIFKLFDKVGLSILVLSILDANLTETIEHSVFKLATFNRDRFTYKLSKNFRPQKFTKTVFLQNKMVKISIARLLNLI